MYKEMKKSWQGKQAPTSSPLRPLAQGLYLPLYCI